MKPNLQRLIARLNPYCTRALEGASGACVNRTHYEVAVEHLLVPIDGRSAVGYSAVAGAFRNQTASTG